MKTHLKNARLIDGTGAPAVEGAALVIEGDTIVHAGRLAAADAPGSDVVDVTVKTIIPGLGEAHIHLSYDNVKAVAALDLNCPPEYSTLVSAKNAELALRCGYTAARSAGSVIIDGDPLRDIAVLQDRSRLRVMKGGRFI